MQKKIIRLFIYCHQNICTTLTFLTDSPQKKNLNTEIKNHVQKKNCIQVIVWTVQWLNVINPQFFVECLMDSHLRYFRIILRQPQIQRYYYPAKKKKKINDPVFEIRFLKKKSCLKAVELGYCLKKWQNWVISCFVLIFSSEMALL